MQKDWFEEIITTIENNAEDNKATITNVELWAKSWREERELALTLYGVTTRLNIRTKVFKKDKSKVGVISNKADRGFNYWIVEWENDDITKEYGLDLNVW